MSTVPVRIRHIHNADAIPLTNWPIADLKGLLSQIDEWQVYTDGDYETTTFGQFVVTEREAYFEIIVGSDDE